MNQIAIIPQPRVQMLRLGQFDRIRIDEIEYTNPVRFERGYVLHRVDAPELAESFTHEELWLLRGRRNWRHDPLWFSPQSARLHLETDAVRLEDLKKKELPDVNWKWEFCWRIRRLHEAGKCLMTSEGMVPAIREVFEELKVLDIALVPKDRKKEKSRKPAGIRRRKAYTGKKVIVVTREPPSPRTVQRWFARLEKRGWWPASLRDGRYRSGCRTPRITGEALRLLVMTGARYATPERPTIRNLYRDLKASVDEFNLGLAEEERILCPSEEALRLYVAGLGRFHVYAGRFGIEKAKLRFAAITSGVAVTRPYERIEIDSWLVDLQGILTVVGLWDRLDGKVRREVARMQFCAAIDVATKVIVGACLSETATTAAALKVLRMAVSNKRAYADAVGAVLPWDQHGLFDEVDVDAGSQFNNPEFIGAVAMLGQSPNFPSGGVPLLRGTIESFFRTVGMQLVARLPGKTFNNVVDRRVYNAEGRACIETSELASLLTRWIVDAYHGSPHDGLAGETPHDAWNRCVRLYDIQDGPDRNRLRAAFGIQLSRKLHNGGLLVLGLRYWCEPLRDLFLRSGSVTVDLLLDPEDVSEISVLIDGTWHAAGCTREGVEDVTVEAWIQASREMALRHREGAAQTEAAVHAAVRAARLVADEAMARVGISSLPPTADDVARAEREILQGWTMPLSPSLAAPEDRADPLARGIAVTGPGGALAPPNRPGSYELEE
ncbi:hypothetical protein [Methylobacterium bullatum]|uniref:Integrase catalytic domain-containing protein n=1 Tax=Methylobacterium bullatum TaxID=570505 RepID=A0A679KAP0_9HYPH|nr:hypothetical protein MBLL_04290 [Methylobacterium bullatum]